jgi:hypothetical protein
MAQQCHSSGSGHLPLPQHDGFLCQGCRMQFCISVLFFLLHSESEPVLFGDAVFKGWVPVPCRDNNTRECTGCALSTGCL